MLATQNVFFHLVPEMPVFPAGAVRVPEMPMLPAGPAGPVGAVRFAGTGDVVAEGGIFLVLAYF